MTLHQQLAKLFAQAFSAVAVDGDEKWADSWREENSFLSEKQNQINRICQVEVGDKDYYTYEKRDDGGHNDTGNLARPWPREGLL